MEINVQVTKDNVCFLDNDQVHENEVNVDTLVFSFSEEYTDDLVKIAVFTNFTGTTYRMTILNNKCAMPYEALLNKGLLTIGVYAFKEQDGELMLRYSPTPLTLSVENGSYIDGQDGTVLVPALTIEQYEQAMQEALTEFEIEKDKVIAEFEEYYNGKVADFNTNATNRTNDYNTNATQKLGAYNTNASEKLGEYNTNASNKTDTFNSNATSKTTAFDNNASDKTTTFNSNATSKTNDFNSNATSKTTDFNNNATSKTGDFNTNATEKTTAFNDNATAKTAAYNTNAEEKIEYYDEHASEIIEMNKLLLDQIPTSTATGETINVNDSSNLPLKNFEMIGNTTQDDTPTPETPQAIHVVTGDNTVKLTGKNLFNEALLSQEENYNSYNSSTGLWTTSSGSGYYRSIPYSRTGLSTNRDISKLIKISRVGTYTAKIYDLVKNGNPGNISFALINKSGEYIDQVTTSTDEATFTNTEPCYLDIRRVNSSGTFSFSKIQIEVGSTATTYEPYTEQTVTLPLGDIELARIGTYQDRIYKDNGKWYVYKAIGKGTISTITLTGTASTGINYAQCGLVQTAKTNGIIWSTNYKNSSDASQDNSIRLANTLLYVYDNTITSQALAEEKLLGLNYYYQLATPTITEITDQALITALEQVLAMTTYKTTTNGFTITVDDNATPTLVMEYRQDIGTLISNLNNAILSLGNNT